MQTILFNPVDFSNAIAVNHSVSPTNSASNESEFSAVSSLTEPTSPVAEVTSAKDTSITNPYSIQFMLS